MPAPIARYVGGKSWLVEGHAHLLPTAEEIAKRGGIYREPFVGGGAVVLGLYAGRCPVAISDTNPWIARAYRTIRDDVEKLLAALAEVAPRYSRETFEGHRDALNAGKLKPIEEAVALFVVLAWGYNGLLRFSKSGRLNTPMGKPSKPGAPPKLYDAENLRAVSVALRDAAIHEQDFEAACADARPGDFLYLDPPYEPASETADFTEYAGGWRIARPRVQGALALEVGPASDLERLEWCSQKLDARGVQWAVSNADVPVVRDIFSRWHITSLSARRSVSSKSTTRGPVGEVLVRNYRSANG